MRSLPAPLALLLALAAPAARAQPPAPTTSPPAEAPAPLAQPGPPAPPPPTPPADAAVPQAGPGIRVLGEARTRGEILRNLDLDGEAVRTGALGWGDGERALLRVRVGLEALPSEHLAVFAQIQDARTFGAEPGTASAAVPAFFHQGWAELRRPGDLPLSLRVGRMELSYGDERLVGAFGWDNVGRAFDGARARAELGEVIADAFFTRLHADPWNDPVRSIGDDFAGLYGRWNASPRLQLDLYLFGLYDRGGAGRLPGGGELRLFTPGVRVDARPLDGLHLNGEAALQFGNRGDQTIAAWAAHAAADYTFAMPLAPKLLAGWDLASGDADPDDDRWATFDNLFPTNHDKYGLIDLAAWKNLNDVFFGAAFAPARTMALQATVHLLARLEDGDTFYRASGAPLVDRALARATDARRVGTELDLTATWKVTEGFGALLGWSRLFAGDFLDQTAAGGEAPDPTFAYLQLTGSF